MLRWLVFDVSDSHQHSDEPEPPTSTGFLPISLALALFITGLFVLDLVPGLNCGSKTDHVDKAGATKDDRR